MVGIIDYGMGNLTSIKNALNFLNIPNEIFNRSNQINKYSKLILPGVGAFGIAMHNLKHLGFDDAIKDFTTIKQQPILGVCLGMQLLFESSSEHGNHKGLGLIQGHVKFLGEAISDLPVPHVGWNHLIFKNDSELLKNIEEKEQIYYFVHSYFCDSTDRSVVKATVNYGISFDVIIENHLFFGCQFHPEKSQKSGLELLKNFNLK